VKIMNCGVSLAVSPPGIVKVDRLAAACCTHTTSTSETIIPRDMLDTLIQ